MSTFIKLLPLELTEVTDYIEPESELGKDDYKVGVMSEDLKKLYTLGKQTMKRTAQLALEMSFGDAKTRERFDAEHDKLAERAKALHLLFWIALKDEFELWGKESVGVRKGFVVTWSDQKGNEEEGFGGLLRKLLEG